MHSITDTYGQTAITAFANACFNDTEAVSSERHEGALQTARKHVRHAAVQRIARLPPALGQPTHISRLNEVRRTEFVDALDYQRAHVFPYLLPGSVAQDAWTRLFCWHETVFHICHFMTAVHMDLIDRKVTRSSNPKTLIHLGQALRGLTAELHNESADLSLVFFTVGLLACHDLDSESMEAMYSTQPLQFVPLVQSPQNLQVFLQMGYNPAHAQAKHRLIHQLGGLDKLSIPGLGAVAAYLEMCNASKLYQCPRYENFWHTERFVDVMRGIPGVQGPHTTSAAAGRGFFLHAQPGLTAPILSILVQFSAVNEWLKHESVTETGTVLESTQRVLRLRNKLQYQLLSLPTWSDLDSEKQKASTRHVYDCVRLAAVIYSNAVLLALPHHTGWHTALAHRLRDLIDLNDWRNDMTMYPVLLWVLTVGGIAAYRSEDRTFYEETLSELLQIMDSPSWKAVERSLEGFLWSREACKHGAAMLWQSL